jgi:hypothetical protein
MHADEGLLLYRQRLARVRPGARGWAWATTDELLTAWLIARCKADRQYIPEGLKRRGANRVQPEARGER